MRFHVNFPGSFAVVNFPGYAVDRLRADPGRVAVSGEVLGCIGEEIHSQIRLKLEKSGKMFL